MGNLETTLGGGQEAFPETVWSSLLGREGPPTPERLAAMNGLAESYWRPVYKFIRTAGGASIEDSKDLTQEFFSYMLEGSVLSKYDPAKGRFRTFLKGVLRNFLSVERRDASRLKRGGGRVMVPLDVAALETPEFLAERDRVSPDEAFDRQWAAEILSESLTELRRQLTAENRGIHLRAYEAYHEIGGDAGRPTYASIGRDLGLSEQQVKDHLAVARERLEKLVRERLARRVASPGEVAAELNDLLFG
ncbi:MAG TPA: sigma-70 family RNA polymerase sigma factor [Planctomycetota bacterium]